MHQRVVRDTAELQKWNEAGTSHGNSITKQYENLHDIYSNATNFSQQNSDNKTIFEENIDNFSSKKNPYSTFLSTRVYDNIYNTKLIDGKAVDPTKQYNHHLATYFKNKKLPLRLRLSGANFRKGTYITQNTDSILHNLGDFEHSNVVRQIPLGLDNNKSRVLSDDF